MADRAVTVPNDEGKAMPMSAPGVKFFDKTLYNREDPNPDFHQRKGIAIYDEMISDPDVDSALARFTMPLESAEVTIEPTGETEAEVRRAEWCRKWILCEGHPTDTWAERMEHSLMMFTYGFSAFEKILGPDGEGGQAWVEFCPILPQTIWEFRVDDRGRFESMYQRAYFPGRGYGEAVIPAEKVALFTFRGRGRNFWGRPLIRSAYKPYWHKHNIEILNGVSFERNAVGFMHINLPDNATAEQIADAENVVTENRGHERGGAVTRGGVKIEFSYPSGTPPDFSGSIRLYAKQIYSVMLADWEQLGAGESGSRAVGGEKIGYALMAYQSVTRRLEGVWNAAIRQMVDLNDGPQAKYPRIQFQDLSKMSGEQMARFLAPLMSDNVKAITRDPDLEQQIRKSNQLAPLSDEDMRIMKEIHKATLERQLETAKNPPTPPPAPGSQFGAKDQVDAEDVAQGEDGEDKPDAEDGPPAKKKAPVEGALPAQPSWRKATELMADGRPHPETFCEFDRMKSLLTSEPLKVWTGVVAPFRDEMIRAAASRLVAMSDSDLRKVNVEIPKRDKLTNALLVPLYSMYLKGRRELKAEIARQAPRQMAASDQEDDVDAEVLPKQKDWIRTIAGTFVVGMLSSMQDRGRIEALNVRQAELPKAQQVARIEAALRDVSEKTIQAKLSGAMSTAFVTGREEQAASMKEEIETSFYSALMDDGTMKCLEAGGTCAILDGDEHAPGDPAYAVPNPNCAWPSNCNCVNVYVAKQQKEAA